MSFLRTLRLPSRSSSSAPLRFRALALPTQRAAFSMGRPLLAGKESSLHDEGRGEEVEKHKHDQLQKQKDGKGHWVDELASDSESAVKADRNESHDHDGKTDFKEMQEATKDHASDKHN